MPDKKFSRTNPADTERKFGDAPILGRVSRTPGGAVSHGARHRHVKRNQKVNVAVFAWTLLVSALILVLLVVFLVSYFRKKAEVAIESSAYPGLGSTSRRGASNQKTVDLPAIGEAKALAIVREAFGSGDAQERMRHFSGTGESNDAIAALTGKEGEIISYRWLGQKYANGMTIGEVATQSEIGGDYSNRVAQLVVGSDGKWRIDSDSYLRKAVPDWPQILSGDSPVSVIRVFLAGDNYYNGVYSDDTKWQAFSLSSPDTENVLYGYVKKGSPQDFALRRILGSEENNPQATLEISSDPESSRRQFEITGVLAEDWVVSGTRYDESF